MVGGQGATSLAIDEETSKHLNQHLTRHWVGGPANLNSSESILVRFDECSFLWIDSADSLSREGRQASHLQH